jgi:aminomethyltransferase
VSLFDISHLGQVRLRGSGAAQALERLLPSDIRGLAPGRSLYSLWTSESGGIIDDVVVTRREDDFLLVTNAVMRDVAIARLADHLRGRIDMEVMADHALLAVQGPEAVAVLQAVLPAADDLRFMQGAWAQVEGANAYVSRSGYTGEDGFEISLSVGAARRLAERLCADPAVALAGIGARNTLRLESGYSLSGEDFDESTAPDEAGLHWVIAARRRQAADFAGAQAILRNKLRDDGDAQWRRIAVKPLCRQTVSRGTAILDRESGGAIGVLTSGSFGPSLDAPVAIGYVETGHAAPGTELILEDGKGLEAGLVVDGPFVPRRCRRRARRLVRQSG